jgi:hypothetical protein
MKHLFTKKNITIILSIIYILVVFILFWVWYGSTVNISTYPYTCTQYDVDSKAEMIRISDQTKVRDARNSAIIFLTIFWIPLMIFMGWILIKIKE